MGSGRMLLLGDWGQQIDIQEQRRELDSLRHQLRSSASGTTTADLRRRLDQLERENDELRLYLASLIRYLGSKGSLDQDEFRRIVDAIDSDDGAADGGYDGAIMK